MGFFTLCNKHLEAKSLTDGGSWERKSYHSWSLTWKSLGTTAQVDTDAAENWWLLLSA